MLCAIKPVIWFYEFKHITLTLIAKVKEKTMAKKTIFLVMLVMVLASGMTVVGCGDGNGDKEQGKFVLTGILAAYNGKYAFLEVDEARVEVIGCQKINMATETFTLSKIANGKVSFPLWLFSEAGISKYSGNDTGQIFVDIYDTATLHSSEALGVLVFPSVTFSNGNATKFWNDGIVDP